MVWRPRITKFASNSQACLYESSLFLLDFSLMFEAFTSNTINLMWFPISRTLKCKLNVQRTTFLGNKSYNANSALETFNFISFT